MLLYSRCLLWFVLDCDLPEEHPRVSQEVTIVTIIEKIIMTIIVMLMHDDSWDEENDSSVQEKDLILSSRSFDPVKSEKLLSGNVFLLLRDMLKNK